MELLRRVRDALLANAKLHQTKVRFLFAGALNTVVGLATFPILFQLAESLKIHYLLIFVISQILCISFSFFTNKFLVFRTSGNYMKESGRFFTFHLFYFLANLVALPTLVEFGRMDPVWAQTLFALLVIFTSYFWHSHVTFRSIKLPH